MLENNKILINKSEVIIDTRINGDTPKVLLENKNLSFFHETEVDFNNKAKDKFYEPSTFEEFFGRLR